MSFQITCPDCGMRPVGEYQYGGPVSQRPTPSEDDQAWTAYIYFKPNVCGVQTEWWYHRFGCKGWFIVERDTRKNQILSVNRFSIQSEDEMQFQKTPDQSEKISYG